MAISESGALPSGVEFVNDQNGEATISGSPRSGTRGTYHLTIVATNGVAPSAMQAFTLYVKLPTSVSVFPIPNPQLVGAPVLVIAALSAGDSGGSVSFSASFDGGAVIPVAGCQSVSLHLNAASCVFTPSTFSGPGTYSLVAVYSGDSNFVSATGSTALRALEPTSLSIGFPANPHRGSPMTLRATVSPTPDTGKVAFSVIGPNGSVPLPSSCAGATVTGGVATCTLTPLRDGTYTVTAVYSGSNLYARSSTRTTVVVIG
jgi:hypothetical protein